MILVSDLGLPEAPVLLPDGGWLVQGERELFGNVYDPGWEGTRR